MEKNFVSVNKYLFSDTTVIDSFTVADDAEFNGDTIGVPICKLDMETNKVIESLITGTSIEQLQEILTENEDLRLIESIQMTFDGPQKVIYAPFVDLEHSRYCTTSIFNDIKKVETPGDGNCNCFVLEVVLSYRNLNRSFVTCAVSDDVSIIRPILALFKDENYDRNKISLEAIGFKREPTGYSLDFYDNIGNKITVNLDSLKDFGERIISVRLLEYKVWNLKDLDFSDSFD